MGMAEDVVDDLRKRISKTLDDLRRDGLAPAHVLGYSLGARIALRLPVQDATSGYRAYRRPVLQSLMADGIHSDGYAFQIEINFLVWSMGCVIKEIPIIFVDRTEGESKMSKRIVREAVWMVWRLRWWSLTGRI